jgi:hypothetical protein
MQNTYIIEKFSNGTQILRPISLEELQILRENEEKYKYEKYKKYKSPQAILINSRNKSSIYRTTKEYEDYLYNLPPHEFVNVLKTFTYFGQRTDIIKALKEFEKETGISTGDKMYNL